MEKLPTHKVLEFHPDTLQFVRKEHGLDKPGQMDAAIDLLDDWVKKQAHFTKKDFPREYLERTIVLDKGSIEKAKLQMDKLFTMRTLVPHFFDKIDAKDGYEEMHELFVDALLPKLTKDHYRIYAGKLKNGVTTKLITHTYQFGALILEHIRSNDYCAGFIGIIDYRDINLYDYVSQLNLLETHQFIMFIMEGYQMRVKGIHILTSSKTIEIVVRIFKQAFSKKIGDRIKVHMTEDSLHECLPKEILPKEFGGELKSLIDLNKDWVEVLGSEENKKILKEISKAKVNENFRNGITNNDDMLGISGSFRTLCVD